MGASASVGKSCCKAPIPSWSQGWAQLCTYDDQKGASAWLSSMRSLRVSLLIEKADGLKDTRGKAARVISGLNTYCNVGVEWSDEVRLKTAISWNAGPTPEWNHSDAVIWNKDAGSTVNFSVMTYSKHSSDFLCGQGSLNLEGLPALWSGQVALSLPGDDAVEVGRVHVSLRLESHGLPQNVADPVQFQNEFPWKYKGVIAHITLRYAATFRTVFGATASVYARIYFQDAEFELVTGCTNATAWGKSQQLLTWNRKDTLQYQGEKLLEISLHNKLDDKLLASGSMSVDRICLGFEGIMYLRTPEEDSQCVLIKLGILWTLPPSGLSSLDTDSDIKGGVLGFRTTTGSTVKSPGCC